MAVVSRSISVPNLLQPPPPSAAPAPKASLPTPSPLPDVASIGPGPTPKAALPIPAPRSDVSTAGSIQSGKTLPSVTAMDPWFGCDDIDLVREVLYYQREGRIVWWQNAGDGAAIGAIGGAVFSIPATIILGVLSGGVGAAIFPVAAAAGAALGSSVGAVGRFRDHARPDDVRKHIFWGLHVVDTREQSEQLVAQLKDAGALSRSRHRRLLNRDAAAAVFAQAGLSETQQQRANRVLEIVAIEEARRAQLFAEAAPIYAELRELRKIRRWNRTPRDILRIEALANQVESINNALLLMPSAPKPQVRIVHEAKVAPNV